PLNRKLRRILRFIRKSKYGAAIQPKGATDRCASRPGTMFGPCFLLIIAKYSANYLRSAGRMPTPQRARRWRYENSSSPEFAHQLNFKPNCTMRGVLAWEPIVPNPTVSLTFPSGAPNWVRLKIL